MIVKEQPAAGAPAGAGLELGLEPGPVAVVAEAVVVAPLQTACLEI